MTRLALKSCDSRAACVLRDADSNRVRFNHLGAGRSSGISAIPTSGSQACAAAAAIIHEWHRLLRIAAEVATNL